LLEKVFQPFLALFLVENNILKMYENQSTGKLTNLRWRPRWPPFHEPGLVSGHNFLLAGLINAVNGSNEASCWHSHSVCGFVNENQHFPYFHPKV